MADPAHFCCTIQVECCAQSRSTPTPNLRLDPVLNESGAPNVINTQPAPKNGSMKESSVEGALSLSTTTDLPTTPTRVYDPNHAARFPEPQVDMYTGSVSSGTTFAQYQGTEKIPILANMQVSSLSSSPQGYSGLPTFPEPRYDPNSRSIPQDSFEQSQGTGNTLRQTNRQVSPSQGHRNPPTLPESQRELYHPSVTPLEIRGQPTLPEPQDGPYAPNVSSQVVFGRRPSHGTRDTLPNIRLGTSRPLA